MRGAELTEEAGGVGRDHIVYGCVNHLNNLGFHSASKGSHWMLSTERGTDHTYVLERSCWLMRENGLERTWLFLAEVINMYSTIVD